MAQPWLEERWSMLRDVLAGLTVGQEAEIARICEEEKQFFRDRFPDSLSSRKKPMTWTRNEIKSWPYDERTQSWLNPKEGKKEHIALKYMNWSPEEYEAMNASTKQARDERHKVQLFLDDPDAIVAKAVALLRSPRWAEVVVGLAVCTGRRESEVLKSGEFSPRTDSAYSVLFRGQLKTKAKVLAPYEIPTLCEASLVLEAWQRLRKLVDCSAEETDLISSKYGPDLSVVANAVFGHLVPWTPDPEGRQKGNLYTALFRKVYGRLAVFYYAPPETLDITYMNHVYGHYKAFEDTGDIERQYDTTMSYLTYQIADAVVFTHQGKRQGVKLSDPGVQVLEVFRPREVSSSVPAKKGKKMVTTEVHTEDASRSGWSSIRPRQETKLRFDQVHAQTSGRIPDDTLNLLLDEHDLLIQLREVVSEASSFQALASLLAVANKDAALQLKEKMLEEVRESELSPLADLLAGNETLLYLAYLLAAKRSFKQSYEKRYKTKDYATMSLTELRDTKTTEASYERFRRGVEAIKAYNEAAPAPEMKWYINPAVLAELMTGKPALASDYLNLPEIRADIKAHHEKHELTAGSNRRPASVKIWRRVAVPERPSEEPNLERQMAEFEEREARRKAKKASTQEE